jgi:16S rRNA (cytosine1402-N4)-methyltransferase
MVEPAYHIPVLLHDSVDGLNIVPDGIYADLTFGGGGHSHEILKRLGPDGRLLVFDQDLEALQNAPDDERIDLIHGNFSYLQNYLKYFEAYPVDGILADLGVSSHHFDDEKRGFSFRFDAPLDMRMNQTSGMTAADLLQTYTVDQLAKIFKVYGEIEHVGKLLDAIVKARSGNAFERTSTFVKAIETCIPKHQEHKYLAKVFQALRIEVNHELEALEQMLKQTIKAIAPGGRLSIITYHSLEDRLVKNFIKTGNVEGKLDKDFYGHVHRPFEEVNRKIIVPSEAEIELNNRARSAKLRIAERKEA